MEVEIKIDESCPYPKLIIVAPRLTEEVEDLVRLLSDGPQRMLAGFRAGGVELLAAEDITRIYAGGGKVFAVTSAGEYVLRSRLYELEGRLDPRLFVRISNSELINLRRVKGFDLSFSGTICVTFLDGSTSYVSRRYVARLKQVLGI